MPALIRLYIRQVFIGFALSAVFVGLLFWFNVAGLWHLVSTSDVGILAAVILFMLNGIVFASVQFAIVVMGMADTDDDDRGHKTPDDLMPIPVQAQARTVRHPRKG